MIGKVAVVGAGSWGTTVAHLCSHLTPTVVHSRRPEVAESINRHHQNRRYLEGFDLHPDLRAVTDLGEAVRDAGVVFMGVPSHGFRDTLRELKPHVPARVPVVSLAKGLERPTKRRMTEIVAEELPDNPAGVLTGPNLAKEILGGQAAAAVIAMEDLALAEAVQALFTGSHLRVYTNDDVVGCEIAGALKNVIALASGMADGLGGGDNTRAAVITRGLAELTRLGEAVGGRQATFAGLAGMGDLVATCVSSQSRNRHVGEQLGRGRKVADIVAEMDQVAEGVKSTPVAVELGRELGVEMPIAEEVRAVLEDGRSVRDAYRVLLWRPHTSEYRPARDTG